MKKLDRIIRLVEEARRKDLAKPPKKLSAKYTHYVTTKTKSEQAVQNIERINRNSPIITYKIKPINKKKGEG
jgi:5'-deoxynucleotidase YfbR-like HD superfamily hydrolase